VKKVLANPEPSTHGTKSEVPARINDVRFWKDSVAKVGGVAALIYRRCFLSLFLICEA
jgi:hypothetical protein